MGAQTSAAMKKARKLLAANPDQTDKELARRAGLHHSSPGKDAVCQAIRAKHPKPSKVAQAAALVESGALNQRDAAIYFGVSESAVSKFRKRQQQKEQQDG